MGRREVEHNTYGNSGAVGGYFCVEEWKFWWAWCYLWNWQSESERDPEHNHQIIRLVVCQAQSIYEALMMDFAGEWSAMYSYYVQFLFSLNLKPSARLDTVDIALYTTILDSSKC